MDNSNHDINGSWRQIFVALLIALCSGSLGFGISQMSVIPEVRANKISLENLKDERVEDKKQVDVRISELVGLMNTNMKLNSDLIELVRVQNQLLTRDRK
jgi:hypothetical protein